MDISMFNKTYRVRKCYIWIREQSKAKDIGEGRPKWAPEVKWATPITANLVNDMAKI